VIYVCDNAEIADVIEIQGLYGRRQRAALKYKWQSTPLRLFASSGWCDPLLTSACGLRIEDFAASGPTAIADLRLSEDSGEKRRKTSPQLSA
jgi:hypothetical protein